MRSETASGPATRDERAVDAAHPRDDRAVVEAQHELASASATVPADALDDAHDVGRLVARRHEVDHADRAVGGLQLGLEDERVAR